MKIIKKHKLNKDKFNDWILDNIDDYKNRYEVYYGGGGSGKSVGAVQKMILKALGNKRKVLVVRKVASTLSDSIYSVFTSLLNEQGIAYKENKTDKRLEILRTGSIILFKGMDNPEKIKSIADITDIVIEEATELTLDDFTQLDIRLRPFDVEYPQIYLMFNPVSKVNWVFKHWFLTKQKNTKIIQTNYLDNKFLGEEYKAVLENLKNSNPSYYKIYCLGEFATLDKLIFPIIHKQLINQDEIKHLRHFCGMDFGYVNDPTAIIWGRYDKENKTIYITGEYFKKGLVNDEIYKVINSLGLRKEVIIADCADQKSIEEIRRLGASRIRECKKFNDSLMFGIQWLIQHKIIIDERLTNLIEEFENYTWEKDKKTGEYINKPIDNFNHGIDALRYGLEDYMHNKVAKVVNSSKWKGIF